jgi:hypothetical protein
MKKKIAIGILVVLALIQFIRPHKNSGGSDTEKDITHFVDVPANVKSILKTSCYDCHSNHTNYYWYHEIMPLGWWLNHHVEDGRKHLNFSDFSKYSLPKIDHKLEEIAEEVGEHEMPLSSYTMMHKDAELSAEQVKVITDWVTAERAKLSLK